MLRWEVIKGLDKKRQHFVSCFVNREIGCIYYLQLPFYRDQTKFQGQENKWVLI